jgi:hypothetical protein
VIALVLRALTRLEKNTMHLFYHAPKANKLEMQLISSTKHQGSKRSRTVQSFLSVEQGCNQREMDCWYIIAYILKTYLYIYILYYIVLYNIILYYVLL